MPGQPVFQGIQTGNRARLTALKRVIQAKAATQPAAQPLGWFEAGSNMTFSGANVLLWNSKTSVNHLAPFPDFTQLLGGGFVNEQLPRTFNDNGLIRTQIVARADQNPLAGLFSHIGVPFGTGPAISELTMILCFRPRSLGGGSIIASFSDPRLFQSEEVFSDPGIAIIADADGLSVIQPNYPPINGGPITVGATMIASFRLGTDFLSLSLKNNGIEKLPPNQYGGALTANSVNFTFGWGVVLSGQAVYITESDLLGAMVCTTGWSDNEIASAERYFAERFRVSAYTYVPP